MTRATDRSTQKDELHREIQRMLVESRQERLSVLGPETQAYLALAPLWTEELAAAAKFPHSGRWEEFWQQAISLRLLAHDEGDPVDDGRPNRQFWMPAATRPGTLDTLRRELGSGFLEQMVPEVGQRILSVERRGRPAPEATRRWAELAREAKGGPGHAARWLRGQIDRLVSEGAMAQAEGWLAAGELLGAALLGELQAMLPLAEWTIRRGYRHALDRRYLEKYVVRDEQEEAFRTLIRPDGPYWALHYYGMGGVGKTMLLRRICAQLAGSNPVARVDFDYLNPGYPTTRPAELIGRLADELRPFFVLQNLESKLEDWMAEVGRLHDKLSGDPPAGDPLANVHGRDFGDIRDWLADLVKQLPQPVILILDTCEELIKLQLAGGELPHVSATFEILEALHERAPGIRVILAGRRLLAQEGAGWRADPSQHLAESEYRLETCPYLGLHLVRGFNHDEAEYFLGRFDWSKPELAPQINRMLLQLSPDTGVPAPVFDGEGRPLTMPPALYDRVRAALAGSALLDDPRQLDEALDGSWVAPWLNRLTLTGDRPERAAQIIRALHDKASAQHESALAWLLRRAAEQGPEKGQSELAALADEAGLALCRYNPFNLDLYAEWLVKDPKVGEFLSGGTDPYVEMRIVERVRQTNVHELLPAVALLRRFDAQMLKPAYTGPDGEYETAFRALSDQEWLDYQRDPETGVVTLEVDPNLHPRLRAFYEHHEREAKLETARKALAPALEKTVRETPLRELSQDAINAALCLLPPAAAALLWLSVEARIHSEADWSWALNVTRLLLSQEVGAAGPLDSSLRATVLATYAAANVHLGGGFDPRTLWEQVGETAEHNPHRPVARWLARRAEAGRLAAEQVAQQKVAGERLAALWTLLDQLAFQPGGSGDPETDQRAEEAFWAGLEDGTRLPAGWHGQQLAAAEMAAVEAVLDGAEQEPGGAQLPDPELVWRWAQTVSDPQLAPYARALAARCLALCGRPAPAALAEALWADLSLAASSEPGSAARAAAPWLDWDAPGELLERVRLTTLGLPPLEGLSPVSSSHCRAWLDEITWRFGDNLAIDGERLLAAALRRMLADGRAAAELLELLAALDRFDPRRQPRCLAHRRTPPLFVALAEGWLALGKAERAVSELQKRQDEALGVDRPTVTAATQTLARVAARMRMQELATELLSRQASVGEPAEEFWPAGVLSGALRPEQLPPAAAGTGLATLHAWWRCQADLTPERLRSADTSLVAAAPTVASSPPMDMDSGGLLATLVALDARELTLLAPAGQPALSAELYEALQRSANSRIYVSLQEQQSAGETRWASGPAIALRLALRAWMLDDQATAPEQPAGVGTREMALITLEEGEMLALRRPDLGKAILEHARNLFGAANDPVGALQAATLATLAALQAGEKWRAREMVDTQLRPGYEQLREELGPDTDLPTWEAVKALEREAEPTVLAELGPSRAGLWSGWLQRVLVCVLETGRSSGTARKEIKSWLAERNPAGLPREMDLSYEAKRKDEEPAASSDWGVWVIVGISIVLGLAFLVGLFLGTSWLIDKASPQQSLTFGAKLGLFVLGLFLIYMIRLAVALVQKRLAAATLVRLVLNPAALQSAAGAPYTARLQQQPLKFSLWRGLYRPAAADTQMGGETPGAGPYVEAAGGLPAELVEPLQELTGRLSGWPASLMLVVDQALAAAPWEAALLLAVRDPQENKWKEPFQVWRQVLEPAPADEERQQQWREGSVQVVADKTWTAYLERAWEPLAERVTITQDPQELAAGGPFKLVHLAGRLVETDAGLMQQSKMATENEFGTRRPDLWQQPLRQAALVVLQGELAELGERQELDRRAANRLRAQAAELARAGAPAVVVLPALPPALTAQLLNKFARKLAGNKAPSRRRLLQAVSGLRDGIYYGPGAAGTKENPNWEQRAELALDVCVYTRLE